MVLEDILDLLRVDAFVWRQLEGAAVDSTAMRESNGPWSGTCFVCKHPLELFSEFVKEHLWFGK